MKTEPAFATVLRIESDPYGALLDLQDRADATLIELLERVGFVTYGRAE